MPKFCFDDADLNRELWTLTKLAVPLMVAAASDYFGKVLTSIFAGQILTTEEFDAVALGNTVTNITGCSMILAFASPMDSLCTQANGARNWKLFSATVRRALICTTLLLIPIVILWLNMEQLLILSGQDPGISHNVYRYALVYLPMMPAYAIRIIAARFLSSQGISTPMLYIGILVYCIWHPALLSIIFTVLGRREFLLFPICNVVTAYLQIALIVGYIVIRKPHNPLTFMPVPLSTIFQWKINEINDDEDGTIRMDTFVDGSDSSSEQFADKVTRKFPFHTHVIGQGFSEYFQLLVAGVFTMCGEWWAWDLITIIVGLLGPTQLAVDVICSAMIPMYYMIPLGFGLAGASRIGTLIGEKRYGMAKRLGNAILWFTLVMATLLAIISFALREYIPRLFTSDQEVIDIAVKLSPLFSLFAIPHMMQGSFQGILRGIKRQSKSAVAVLIGLWSVGIPLACLLAFHPQIDFKIFGMWAGNNVGYYVADAILLHLWLSFEWDQKGKVITQTHSEEEDDLL